MIFLAKKTTMICISARIVYCRLSSSTGTQCSDSLSVLPPTMIRFSLRRPSHCRPARPYQQREHPHRSSIDAHSKLPQRDARLLIDTETTPRRTVGSGQRRGHAGRRAGKATSQKFGAPAIATPSSSFEITAAFRFPSRITIVHFVVHPGFTISAKFRRNFGKFSVSASYREKKFRYFPF